jgi:hypothetical protein
MEEFPLEIGDDTYVREPKRFAPESQSICGPVLSMRETDGKRFYTIAANIFTPSMPIGQREVNREMEFEERDIGFRGGTPINQLSGRPGHRGYAEFCRIAATWGYD